MKTVQFSEHFETALTSAKITKAELARKAGISQFTIHRALNPSSQAGAKGGVRLVTARKIVEAYASLAKVRLSVAVRRLFADPPPELISTPRDEQATTKQST